MTIDGTISNPHHLDGTIKILEGSVKSKPDVAKFHAALGVLYMRRNDQVQNDVTRALQCFRKAIEIAPDHEDSILAYVNRGKLYRIQKLYDMALKDLNKAKEFFGQISQKQQDTIETELNLVQQAMKKRELQSPSTTTTLPHLKAGGGNEKPALPDIQFYEKLRDDERLKNVAPSATLFFSQLLLFLNKKMDSQVNAIPNSGSELYWKAFALCSKALTQEKEFGMTDFIKGLYFQAKETFEELLNHYKVAKKSPPSIIHYVAATVYFKMDYLEKSLEQLDLAIEANPDGDATYYRFRALLNEQLKKIEAAKADEQMVLKIDPNPPYYSMVLSAYNEVSHCIEFYDQVVNDNTNYYIPDSLYESVAEMGVDLIPKRGKDLDPLNVLYAKRAMLSAILGRTDPDKLTLSIKDAGIALSQLSMEDPTYIQVLIGRAQVHYHMKNYEEALEDLDVAIEMVPKHADFFLQRAQVHFKMKNYKEALADLQVASSLNPDRSDEVAKMIQFVETTIEDSAPK